MPRHHYFLFMFAFVCFLVATFPGSTRVNLVALGLAAATLTLLI